MDPAVIPHWATVADAATRNGSASVRGTPLARSK